MSDAPQGPTFAELISAGRRRKGWSQDDLEAASEVSRSTLSRWERGLAGNPEPAHVRAVCAALDIDPLKAAVALGYLTAKEVDGPIQPINPELEDIFELLQDPALSATDRQAWIDYLHFLRDRGRRQVG
jgi:transcriptional regulator with XRE-family HTH domain